MANHHPAPQKKKLKAAEDVVAFMKQHNGPNPAEGSPQEEASESPALERQEQAFGIDKPTQGDPAKVGFQSVNSHGGSTAGRSEPSSKFRGTGKKKVELSPNNTKKAGPMTKGKPGHGLPVSNAAIHRKLGLTNLGSASSPSKAQSAREGAGRSGILSKFEGFNNPQKSQ